MESVLKGVLQEELERNLQKQSVFTRELSKYKKGSLQFEFYTSGIFWANLNFSSPRVPRVAYAPILLSTLRQRKF